MSPLFRAPPRRLLVPLASAVLASALLAGCGGNSSANPTDTLTTGNYAPLTVPKPLVPGNGFAGPVTADPDSELRQGQDLQTVLTHTEGNHFTLRVINVSSLGSVEAFTFFPPQGTTITRLTGVSGHGRCDATAATISCTLHLHPPSCTCRGDGGQVLIGFDVTRKSWLGKGLLSGSVSVTSMTPLLYGVPSVPQSADVNCKLKSVSPAVAHLCPTSG